MSGGEFVVGFRRKIQRSTHVIHASQKTDEGAISQWVTRLLELNASAFQILHEDIEDLLVGDVVGMVYGASI